MNNINITQLTTSKQLANIQHIEESVWAMAPIPVHQTFTAAKNGGIILGAFTNEKMIGFLYSFPGFKNGHIYLCSHMLGILPEYQRGGLGAKMKLKQADIAKNMGYSLITWTFDPLESINAYVNIHKLRAIGASYSEDHYGDLADELNDGLPTDRIEIEWDLTNESNDHTFKFDEEKALLTSDKRSRPLLSPIFSENKTFHHSVLFVEIPINFQYIKEQNFELAKQWRYNTRKVFKSLFNKGYTATNMIYKPKSKQSFYVFTK